MRLDLNNKEEGITTNQAGKDVGTDSEELVWERVQEFRLGHVKSEFCENGK